MIETIIISLIIEEERKRKLEKANEPIALPIELYYEDPVDRIEKEIKRSG